MCFSPRQVVYRTRALFACVFCIGLLALSKAEAQQFGKFQHSAWTELEGAPADISSLAQSTDGYLWIGSPTGLVRFDGHSFQHFDLVSSHVPSPEITTLVADKKNGIWVGMHTGGVLYINPGHTISYGTKDGISEDDVRGMAMTSDGALWAEIDGRLFRFADGKWEDAGKLFGLDEHEIGRILVDSQGTLWVQQARNLFRFIKGARRFEREQRDISTLPMASSSPGPVWTAWVQNSRGHLFPQTGFVDSRQDLWQVNSKEQVCIHRLDSRAHLQDKSDACLPADNGEALDNMPILEDREGNLWLATSKGLHRFRESVYLPAEKVPVKGGAGIAADRRGRIWVIRGFPSPLLCIDGNKVRSFGEDSLLTALYAAPDGIIWFAGDHGLSQLSGEQIRSIPLPPEIKGDALVQAISQDVSGNLLLSVVHRGLYRMRGSRWERIDGQYGFPEGNPIVIAKDARGSLWLGYANNRIARVDAGGSQVFTERDGVSVGNAASITEASGSVWVGGSDGLNFLRNNRFNPVESYAPVRLEGVSGIVPSADGALWLNTVRGIIRLSSGEIAKRNTQHDVRMQAEVFDYSDGVTGTPPQRRRVPTAAGSRDGRLWFATSNELGSIDENIGVHDSSAAPPAVLEGIRANGKDYPSDLPLELPISTDQVQFNYNAISLRDPGTAFFRYKLEGEDSDWHEQQGTHEAVYTGLHPGHYRFLVEAANKNGVWNGQQASLNLEIPPHFYQTRSFLALCAVVSLAIICILFFLQLHRVSRRIQERLTERLLERERIARELHDTLLQGVQGLILQFEASLQLLRDEEPVKKQMVEALDRAEHFMVEGRDRVKDIRSSMDVVVRVEHNLASAAKEFVTMHPADFSILVEGDPIPLHPVVCEESYWIGREALVNAFQHAQASRIEAEVHYGKDKLRIRVRDNGIGIEPSIVVSRHKNDHWGMPGMYERSAKIGGKLNLWSRLSQGTEVELVIPGDVAYRVPRRKMRCSLSRFFSRAGANVSD